MDAIRKQELLTNLVDYLVEERKESGEPTDFPGIDMQDTWAHFRALVNTRQPLPAPESFLNAQDELLSGMIVESGITKLEDLEPIDSTGQLYLWRGDITTLQVDAIVNAANSRMLGCWVPGHYCIDNAIHTFAGVQLRIECNALMQAQGHDEPTAHAKITPAYNLPSRFIIHTVGPIAKGNPTPEHEQQLAQCYRACLDCAAEASCASLAFCSISTGVFGFPKKEAAAIAVRTVQTWLAEHNTDSAEGSSTPAVVFNVFSEEDEAIYKALLCKPVC